MQVLAGLAGIFDVRSHCRQGRVMALMPLSDCELINQEYNRSSKMAAWPNCARRARQGCKIEMTVPTLVRCCTYTWYIRTGLLASAASGPD